MCGSLFFALLSNFAAYLVIGARALSRVLPIGDVLPSLYNVFIGFSVYGNDFGNDELIHRLTLQQSADVLVQKHGYQ